MSDISKILSTIDAAVSNLDNAAQKKQAPIYRELVSMLKRLDTKGDKITNNINNLKLINNIKVKLERLMIDDKYKAELKKFGEAFNDVQQLHNQYFSTFSNKAKGVEKTLNVLRTTAIETTITNLTETGLSVGVTDGIRKILLNNIITGGSYSELTDKLRSYMGADGSDGALQKYVRTYANTAINQFSAEYNKSFADGLGLEWYMYTGSLLETSRDFCKLAVEKKYFHVSEILALLKGDFGPLGKVPLSNTTGLPAGMMEGTNTDNFLRRRGGWNCGHQSPAVDEIAVPQSRKDEVYRSQAYKDWAAANGKKPINPNGENASDKIKDSLSLNRGTANVVLPFTKPIIDKLYNLSDEKNRQKLLNTVFNDEEMTAVNIGVADGGVTKIHNEHKKGGRWKETLQMAKALNKKNIDIGFLPEAKNTPSPDAIVRINGRFRISDFKHTIKANSNTLSEAMKTGFNQTGNKKTNGHLVFKFEQQDLGIISDAIERLKLDKDIRVGDITFINRNNVVKYVERKDLLSGKYKKILKGFF